MEKNMKKTEYTHTHTHTHTHTRISIYMYVRKPESLCYTAEINPIL